MRPRTLLIFLHRQRNVNMLEESYVGSRAPYDISLAVLRKFGKRHQPLGYYRLNDKSINNIRRLLLAHQNEGDCTSAGNSRVTPTVRKFKLPSFEYHHKLYVEDVEIHHGHESELPWIMHTQCSQLLQGQIHGLW